MGKNMKTLNTSFLHVINLLELNLLPILPIQLQIQLLCLVTLALVNGQPAEYPFSYYEL
jgi:hypothetical protein